MERLELEVSLRETTGKGAARKLRARGEVPAVVYGAGAKSVGLAVKEQGLAAVMRQGTNQILDLKGPKGFRNRLVLLKEAQRDPVSDRVLHCDFYAVDTAQKIDVVVPIQVEGKAPGVEVGGILELVLREVAVRCLPLSIPGLLSIDVSNLEIGGARHVSDLELPEEVELTTDPSFTLVHVVAPRVEEEAAPEEEEEAVAVEGEAPAEEPTPAAGEAAPAEESSG